jgi:transposase
MLTASPATRVLLAAGATDMRKSFDTLGALVRNELGGEIVSGHLFVFCNSRRDRIKVLFFDGSGLWVCAKRLEKGTFWWPDASHRGAVEMTSAEFSALIGGLDLQGMRRRRWYRVQQAENDSRGS